MTKIILWIKNHRWFCFAALLFAIFVWLRFMDLETRAVFGFDQIKNSWVVRNMLVHGRWPLLGMVAKGNTGFYIGPAYYYLLAIFYWIFNMDPIGGMVFVGALSCVTYWVLFVVVRKVFNDYVAIISLFIYTFSSAILAANRVPWPVVFIPITSLLVFFSLYRVLQGKTRYLLLLASVIGFAFHIHFTAVYFVIIVICCTPFILMKKDGLKYSLIALPFFLIWLIPNIVSEFQTGFSSGHNMTGYLTTFYHGFHWMRVYQLVKDAVIEFESIMYFKQLRFLHVILPIAFIVLVYIREKVNKVQIILLFLLWVIVPWFVMATYKGEISNYYFSTTQPIAVIAIAYIVYVIAKIPYVVPTVFIVTFGFFWAYTNMVSFFETSKSHMPEFRETAKKAVREGKKMEFSEWIPEPYIYEMYMDRKQKGIFKEE